MLNRLKQMLLRKAPEGARDREAAAQNSGILVNAYCTLILDALDLHYRLHWYVRQMKLDGQEPPPGLEGGVIQERHHALNWLVRFEDRDWDDVDTPT